MEVLRVLASAFIFSVSTYLIYDLFANGFNWIVIVAIVIGYTLVHFIWPKGKKQDSAWYELLELVFDLPYRTIAFFVRGIGRIIRTGDGGVDIDL